MLRSIGTGHVALKKGAISCHSCEAAEDSLKCSPVPEIRQAPECENLPDRSGFEAPSMNEIAPTEIRWSTSVKTGRLTVTNLHIDQRRGFCVRRIGYRTSGKRKTVSGPCHSEHITL